MHPHSSAKLRAAWAAEHCAAGCAFDAGWSSTGAWRGVAGGVSGAGGWWALSAGPCAGAGMSGFGQVSRDRTLGGLLAREPGLPRGCGTAALMRLVLPCVLHGTDHALRLTAETHSRRQPSAARWR